jgi:tetratricopeptide (TPR) repeat protein
VRALANVVLERPDDALSDAEMVMSLSSRDDPEALNHRAYIRALVGRDLPAALEDIDRALAGGTESAPEMVDTRGYLLHLVGRHREAVDQLNEAINGLQQARRRLSLLSGRIDPVDLACRVRAMDHALAVMLHHRALACRAVGLEEQARQDFELAERKGFDPSRGIF